MKKLATYHHTPTLYRYKQGPLLWLFTDKIRSGANIKYRLTYQIIERRFAVSVQKRSSHFDGWLEAEVVTDDALITRLRGLLSANEIAACAAASLAEASDD
ncbi:MAG: hypothetical protein IKE42_15195 [Aquamicrobium sp.]|nr:hypothetical protein [Aquamicrobium sp.]